MAIAQHKARKTELSPVEALIVERRLNDEARASSTSGALARIQALTKERQKLYAKSASHPYQAFNNRARVMAISAEIEALWESLRRQRAGRRAQIERSLNVEPEDDDQPRPQPIISAGTTDAA
ncbi:MAG TPA: hypothetical protein VF808_11675 [Ktedonobacterales bacterium]